MIYPEIYQINHVQQAYDFYISFNPSVLDYGCETTALVLGQGSQFFILKGDHRNAYSALIGKGFVACLNYYWDNFDLAHSYTNKITSFIDGWQSAMSNQTVIRPDNDFQHGFRNGKEYQRIYGKAGGL